MDPFEKEKRAFSRSIAVVSGKGGSGKTMVCAVLGLVLDELGHRVVIFDADTGTAGMTYYLGLKLVSNTRVGLANLATASNIKDAAIRNRVLQKIVGFSHGEFLGIGDHRRLEKYTPAVKLPELLTDVL